MRQGACLTPGRKSPDATITTTNGHNSRRFPQENPKTSKIVRNRKNKATRNTYNAPDCTFEEPEILTMTDETITMQTDSRAKQHAILTMLHETLTMLRATLTTLDASLTT